MNQSTTMACDFSMKSFSISRYIVSSVGEGGREDWMLPAVQLDQTLEPVTFQSQASIFLPQARAENNISGSVIILGLCLC